MLTRTIIWTALAGLALLTGALPARAQIVEAVGDRALGMGGAFVAVANDSSATWWNPAGLADGAFFDLSIARAVSDRQFDFPAARDRVSTFALSTPVIGASVYRFVLSDAAEGVTIGQVGESRQDGEAYLGLRSWSALAYGVTIVQTLVEGTHVGATLKYVRGTLRGGVATSATGPEEALEQAADLEGGEPDGEFDLDVGVLATAGALRLGVLVRNMLEPSFADGAFTLPRQARVGVAVSVEEAGGPPLTISVDFDVMSYAIASGKRRVIAFGAEQWLVGKRLGLRGGARFNQVGRSERAFTAGASVALRSGSYFEAHVVGGGSPGEQGWGTGVRVSF